MDNIEPGMKAAFLARLIAATVDNTITWTASEGRSCWYYVEIGPFSYAIEATDGDDAPPFDFHVFNGKNHIGGSVELEVWGWRPRVRDPLNNYLRALYVAVRGQAHGVANFAAELFSTLAQVDGGSSEPSTIELSENPEADALPV